MHALKTWQALRPEQECPSLGSLLWTGFPYFDRLLLGSAIATAAVYLPRPWDAEPVRYSIEGFDIIEPAPAMQRRQELVAALQRAAHQTTLDLASWIVVRTLRPLGVGADREATTAAGIGMCADLVHDRAHSAGLYQGLRPLSTGRLETILREMAEEVWDVGSNSARLGALPAAIQAFTEVSEDPGAPDRDR